MGSSERVRNLFAGASELAPERRAAYLDEACGGDASLRAEVEGLLKSHEEAGRFMSSPTGVAGAGEAETVESARVTAETGPVGGGERAGMRIGPYKILQQIGEGGFGSVFMAEQERPVVRKVALKIIKLGMDTRAVIARFEAERQALAMMDHPNIAKVLDAGSTETGRPYFVMELVKGDPIVEYCDRNSLSIEDRLELFAQVCQAVQHAHTKGIIHRDIKPSNILVSTQDGRPHTKVIDFGIAKATASKLTEKTLFTEHRQLIGTPEYMSPEQAEGSLDIDTRTDVYSLGVLLYELLTGTTPFSSKELRSAAYAEIQRIIREVEPPKPSTRLSINTETIASIAAKRHTEPRRLGTIIRGELDWIVMKALEKDRQRRYETANGLAMDVRRYLSGEAVVAAPPSTAYRFKKFARRNRVMVMAGSAVAAALLIGVVAFAWQAQVARKQEAEAKTQAAIAEAVTSFQTKMLAAADPLNLLGDKVTVLQAMQAAVQELDAGSLEDQPLVEARVRDTIGITLRRLARYDDAESNLRKSLEIRRTALPAGHPDIAMSLENLVVLLRTQNKLREAEPLARESLAIRRAALPAGHPDIAMSLNNLAGLLRSQNRLAEAEPLMREALAIRRAALPAGHPDIASSLSWLGGLLKNQNKLAEAEPLYREALAIYRTARPAGHPHIATALNNLAELLRTQNKLAEAEPLYREALEIDRAALPAGHPDIAFDLNNLALLLKAQNKPAEAEPLYREALAIRRTALPAGHPDIAMSLNNLARLLRSQNRLAEAEPLMREALAIRRAALPAGHPDIASSLSWLGGLLKNQNKLAEAEPLYREALAIYRTARPAGHPHIATALNNLAELLRTQNKLAEAEPLYREALEIDRAALPAGHPDIAFTLNNLALLLKAQNKLAEAEPLYRESLAIRRAALAAGHPDIATSLNNLALLLQAQNKLAEAEPLYRESLAIREKNQPDAWTTFNTRSMLGGALLGQNKLVEAEPLLLEGFQGMKDREAAIPPEAKVLRITEALERLVQLYEAWDKAEPGKGYDAKAAEWRAELEPAPTTPDSD